MIRDAMGNPLKKGDYVHIMVAPNLWINGHIHEANEGGNLFGADQKTVNPDVIRVILEINLADTLPGQKHTTLLRLVNPEVEHVTTKGS